MAKYSEKKRLLLTIGVSVALTGGLVALILSDRGEIDSLNDEIAGLDTRISSADVEIKKTRDREDKVVVFRAIEARELAVLPSEQQIANFYRNLSKFFVAAGLTFRELPESQAVESDLAKGIFVTRSQVDCQGESAALLRFLNMVENDPRLVSIKGLKVEAGEQGKHGKDAVQGPPQHDVTVHMESYYYAPSTLGFKPVVIPGEEQRLQDPAVKQAIADFVPERPDTYVLRPSASRRDPLVDPRERREKVDEQAEATEFSRQEGVVLELESSLRDINEMNELLKALLATGELFKADRLQGDIDGKVNELRGRLSQVSQMKTVTNPTLSVRVQAVQERIDEFNGRRVPRETTVTRSVAEKTLAELHALAERHAYAELGSLGSAWSEFLKGKQIESDARPMLEEIAVLRNQARTLAEADGFVIAISGTIVNEVNPALSMATINGTRLRQGDKVDEKGDVVVHLIQRDGVQFLYKGEVFLRQRSMGPAPSGKPGARPAGAGKPSAAGGKPGPQSGTVSTTKASDPR